MPEIVHNIDLSAIPHRLGQSQDLEAKRLRAWERMSDEEKEWVVNAWDLTGMIPSAPAFREMRSASDRVLYVLVGTEESLTPLELCYLMIARWFRNIDPATARAKMAQLVNQGSARYTGIGRTMATEQGLEKLEEMARPQRRSDDDDEFTRSDHRQSTSRNRVVDRGESPRSSFGDRSAPTGRYRSEIEYDGGRPGRRDDRDSRGDDRGPRRDDRRDDSRGSRGDDRGPRRDDRDPRRDDRRGDSRGSRGSRGDDRGQRRADRGPRRDDRGQQRGGRGAASERRRENLDGPVIDGRDSREHRVNTDGPVIDGRDQNQASSKPDNKGSQRDERGRFVSKSKTD